MVDFDVIMLGLADAADQTSGAERSQGHAAADSQLARLERQCLADRPAGNRDDSQQPARIFGLTLNARPENLVEVELADLLPIIGRLAALDVLDELVDKKGIAPGFSADHVRLGSRDRVVATQERQSQLACL